MFSSIVNLEMEAAGMGAAAGTSEKVFGFSEDALYQRRGSSVQLI